MSYTITDYTNNKIGNGVVVDDYTINTDTLLDLVGKGNIDYSNSIFENFIYLLGNFASPYPPGTNFSDNYKENNDWAPTITLSTSSILIQNRTNIIGTFWFQKPELNVCSNFISKLISGYNDNSTEELKDVLVNSYDPGNYFTKNPSYVYGQELQSGGTLWIYTGENVSTKVSPVISSINGNIYASYDPSLLGWEAYSTVTVSKNAPSNQFALWLNSNDNNFYYYNNSTLQWARIGTPSSIEPTAENTGITVSDGTLWIKDGQLWMKNTTLVNSQSSYPPKFQNETDDSTVNDGWILIGPTSPKPDNQVAGTLNGFNGTDNRYAVLIDSNNKHHDNLLIFNSGFLIAIVSSDEFTVNSTTPILGGDILTPSIEGLKIFPGINLVGDTYFNGQITDGGIDYATKQYVDQVVSGGTLGYTPVQQGGGTNMSSTHIYIGQSSVNGDLLAQAGSQQLGSFAFKTWTNTNFLSLTNGGTVNGPVSLNGGSTAKTVSTNDNSTNIATTAFVNNLLNSNYINKAGDTASGKINFNGGATSTTLSISDNSTNVATTAFVNNILSNYVITQPNTNQVKCNNLVYDTTKKSPYFTSSSWSGYLLTADSSFNYLPTGTNGKNDLTLIGSTMDANYNLPSLCDSNGTWHVLPDLSYLSNNFTGFLKKTGDTATGKINFNGGSTTVTVSLSDNSTNIATTAFVQNNLNKKVSSTPNNTQDHSITNFIRSNNWTGNGSAGLGLWDDTGEAYYIADISYVQNNFLSNKGGTVNGDVTVTGTIYGTCTRAKWGDLAENYIADKNYDFGTIVKIGGSKEITLCDKAKNYFGVISKNPGFVLNDNIDGLPVVMCGRTPVKIKGKIKKGDRIVFCKNGYARKARFYEKNIIGISLEDNKNDEIKLVECFVRVK